MLLDGGRVSLLPGPVSRTLTHIIFIAPVSHQFAVVGDTAVHAKCGNNFWREVVDGMQPGLKRGDFTEALLHGVERVGSLLAAHFPPDANGKTNLPDAVVEE